HTANVTSQQVVAPWGLCSDSKTSGAERRVQPVRNNLITRWVWILNICTTSELHTLSLSLSLIPTPPHPTHTHTHKYSILNTDPNSTQVILRVCVGKVVCVLWREVCGGCRVCEM